MNGSLHLDASDVLHLLSHLPEDGAFLVGGQAVALWAWFHAGRHPDLSAHVDLTSRDVDFHGSVAAAHALATGIGGRVLRPGADHMNSPSVAMVVGVVGGKPVEIDFLHGVLGIRGKDLLSWVSLVEVAGVADGRETAVRIRVMHPLNCLRSRIGNMLSPATRRRDALSFRQLRATLAVLSVHLDDALEEGDRHEFSDCVKALAGYLRTDDHGRRAERELGIDVVSVLQAFADDVRLDPRYRELTLGPMIERALQDRSRRAGPPR